MTARSSSRSASVPATGTDPAHTTRKLDSSEHYSLDSASALARQLCADFADGAYDRLGIISTRYISMLSQEAVIEWLLPLTRGDKAVSHTGSIIFEPDEISILNAVVPEYIAGILVGAVRESFASEVAARRCAMDSAGKNAEEMIENLQLEYNRARQELLPRKSPRLSPEAARNRIIRTYNILYGGNKWRKITKAESRRSWTGRRRPL